MDTNDWYAAFRPVLRTFNTLLDEDKDPDVPVDLVGLRAAIDEFSAVMVNAIERTPFLVFHDEYVQNMAIIISQVMAVVIPEEGDRPAGASAWFLDVDEDLQPYIPLIREEDLPRQRYQHPQPTQDGKFIKSVFLRAGSRFLGSGNAYLVDRDDNAEAQEIDMLGSEHVESGEGDVDMTKPTDLRQGVIAQEQDVGPNVTNIPRPAGANDIDMRNASNDAEVKHDFSLTGQALTSPAQQKDTTTEAMNIEEGASQGSSAGPGVLAQDQDVAPEVGEAPGQAGKGDVDMNEATDDVQELYAFSPTGRIQANPSQPAVATAERTLAPVSPWTYSFKSAAGPPAQSFYNPLELQAWVKDPSTAPNLSAAGKTDGSTFSQPLNHASTKTESGSPVTKDNTSITPTPTPAVDSEGVEPASTALAAPSSSTMLPDPASTVPTLIPDRTRSESPPVHATQESGKDEPVANEDDSGDIDMDASMVTETQEAGEGDPSQNMAEDSVPAKGQTILDADSPAANVKVTKPSSSTQTLPIWKLPRPTILKRKKCGTQLLERLRHAVQMETMQGLLYKLPFFSCTRCIGYMTSEGVKEPCVFRGYGHPCAKCSSSNGGRCTFEQAPAEVATVIAQQVAPVMKMDLISLKGMLYDVLEEERLCLLTYGRWRGSMRFLEITEMNVGHLIGRPDITIDSIRNILRTSRVEQFD